MTLELVEAGSVLESQPFDRRLHRAGTRGSKGQCSYYNFPQCLRPPVVWVQVRRRGGLEERWALCEEHERHVQETLYPAS
jgi:hypothetical protein